MIENFSVFGSMTQTLHAEFIRLFYLLLPVFFTLAIVIDWFRNPSGSPDFLSTIKRAVIACLLVVAFQEISDAIISITSGIADRISDLAGIDQVIKMAEAKTKTYSLSPTSMLLGFNDLIIAIISYLSYVILYLARFITVALYHFMWSLLTILSPILILFTLFRGTLGIPMNLFKSLIEVSSYKIIWAVLSVMIKSLAFGQAYAADGDYLTVIILNFIIALALLGTPMIVKAISGAGLSSMSETLGMGAALAMASIPGKAASLVKMAKPAMATTGSFGQSQMSRFREAVMPSQPKTHLDSNSMSEVKLDLDRERDQQKRMRMYQ